MAATRLYCYCLLLAVCGMSAVIEAAKLTIGDGKCGDAPCDYGPNELNLAITDSVNGDEIVIYSDLFVDISTKTIPTDPDTLLTITKGITIRSVEGERYAIRVGPVGVLHLFSLRSCEIVFKNFDIIRNQDFGGSDDDDDDDKKHHKPEKPKRAPECSDIIIRKVENNYYNGHGSDAKKRDVAQETALDKRSVYPITCLVTSDIRIEGIHFIDNIHRNIHFQPAKIMNVYILNNRFEAPTAVLIEKGATLMHIEIHFNKFLFAGYFNMEFESLPQVNLTHNFWRPCPYRSENMILPIGVTMEDNWLPYCVRPDCSHLGPVESSNVTAWGVRRGFSSIQRAYNELAAMLGKKAIINITITAPFLPLRRTVIIDQLTNIEGPKRTTCEELCFPNSTYPTLFVDIRKDYQFTERDHIEDDDDKKRRRFLPIGIQSIGYSLIGVFNLDVLLADHNQFLWQRDGDAWDGKSKMHQFHSALDSEEADWFRHDSYDMTKRGSNLRMESVFVRGGSAAVVIMGPNHVKDSPTIELTTLVLYGQSKFAIYIANVVSKSRLSGLMIKGSQQFIDSANGLLLDGVGGFDVSFNYYAFMRAGMRLSYTTDTTITCSRYLYNGAAGIEFVGDGSRDNHVNGVTFFQDSSQEIVFKDVSDPSKTVRIKDVLSLGLVRPVSSVIQENSGLNLPIFIEGGPFMNSLNLSATVRQNISSVQRGLTTVNPSIFQITHYTPTFEQCKVDNSFDLLSGTLYSFTNILDSCASHSSRWTFDEPMGKHAPRCRDIEMRSTRVEREPSFETIGHSTQIDWTCISSGKTTNGASHTQLSIHSKSKKETVCVRCSESEKDPFKNVPCNAFARSVQEALTKIRAGDTIIINGVCSEANLLIARGKDNLNITSLGLGTAMLTPGVPPSIRDEGSKEERSVTDVSKMQGPDSVRRYFFLVQANNVSITKLMFNMAGFRRNADGRWFFQGQRIRFAGENKDDPFAYCAIWVNGTGGPVFETDIRDNRFNQTDLNNVCTLYDCNTTLHNNEHIEPATAMKLFADVNRTFANAHCLSRVSSNFVVGGASGVLHEFRCPGNRPERPFSSVHTDRNTYLLQSEFGMQIKNVLGRPLRNDSLHTRNVYISEEVCDGCLSNNEAEQKENDKKNKDTVCTHSGSCLSGKLAEAVRTYGLRIVCDRRRTTCTAQAQILLGSRNLFLYKEELLLGSRSRILSSNVFYTDSMFADTSRAIVGDDAFLNFRSPPVVSNVTLQNMFFHPDAVVACVFNGEVSVRNGETKKLLIRDSTVNGRNVFGSKQFCENNFVGITLIRTRDHMGREIYSERGSQPGQIAFNHNEFVDAENRHRRFCDPGLTYKRFRSGGKDVCDCNFIQQFQRLIREPDPNNPGSTFTMLSECPPDKRHNPKNLFKCIPRNDTVIIIKNVSDSSRSHDHHRHRHRHSSHSDSDDVIRPPAWVYLIIGIGVTVAVMVIAVTWVTRNFSRKSTRKSRVNPFAASQIQTPSATHSSAKGGQPRFRFS